MARNFTVAQLLARGRQKCRQENRNLLSDEEWQAELSTINSEFQGLIVDAGARVFESTMTITASGVAAYDLPDDFLAEVGVDRKVSETRNMHLTPLLVQERNYTHGQTGEARYYSLVGDQIELHPTPSSGTYYLTYAPQAPDISAVATDTLVDVITPAGENFFIWSLCLTGGIKEESDLTPYYEKQVEKYRDLVSKWATQRMLHQPRRKYIEYQTPGNGYGSLPGDFDY